MRGGHLAVHLAAQNGHLPALKALVQVSLLSSILSFSPYPLKFSLFASVFFALNTLRRGLTLTPWGLAAPRFTLL